MKKKEKIEKQGFGLCVGLSIGLGIGMLIGSLLDELVMGMLLGEGIVMVFGVFYDNYRIKNQKKEVEKR